MSPNVELDDLISYGMTGLVESAQRFDPKVGANFTTFSYYRIRGAIYDGLRSMGWMSRTEYQRQKFEEKACAYMDNDASRSTIVGKKSSNAKERVGTLAKKVQRLVTIYITSLGDKEANEIADESSMPIDDKIARLELYEKMRKALGKLPDSEQKIIRGYYFEELSLEEIGKRLGLSKSWTSRRHARAMEMLSDKFHSMLKPRRMSEVN
jgi:RNA polymerase sigma factor for flagellar operon FliA